MPQKDTGAKKEQDGNCPSKKGRKKWLISRERMCLLTPDIIYRSVGAEMQFRADKRDDKALEDLRST